MTYSSDLCHGCTRSFWDWIGLGRGSNYFEQTKSVVYQNHAQYASCQGYTYVSPDSPQAHKCYDEMLPIARMVAVPAWAKVPLLWNCLKHFDWVLWLDADVLVRNQSIAVEHLVGTYSAKGRCDMIVAEDVVPRGNLFNTGVMLLRGTPHAKSDSWAERFLHRVMETGWKDQQEHGAGWEVSEKQWNTALQNITLERQTNYADQEHSTDGRRLWEQRYMHKYYWDHPAERSHVCMVHPPQKLQAMVKKSHSEQDAFAVHFTYANSDEHLRSVANYATRTCQGKAGGPPLSGPPEMKPTTGSVASAPNVVTVLMYALFFLALAVVGVHMRGRLASGHVATRIPPASSWLQDKPNESA